MDNSYAVPPPNPNTTKRNVRPPLASKSGHQSAYSSHLGHRVRTPTETLDLAEKMSPGTDSNGVTPSLPPAGDDAALGLGLGSPGVMKLLSFWFPAGSQLSRQRFWYLRLAMLLYCALSTVFFSLSLRAMIYTEAPSAADAAQVPESNPLEALPMDHLLSKLTSIYPSPRALDAYVLKGHSDLKGVTACLWATDQDLNLVLPWASRWTGPISLLVTTTVDPSSPEHEALLYRVSTLQTKNPLLNITLSLHLVHLAPRTPDNPNAFLNLARLLAPTPRVALFPANLSTLPPRALYAGLLAPAASSALAVEPEPRRSPVVLTSRGQTGFPFAPLAPAVLGRDDPLWCTERFFPPAARAADWEECVWQLWLENFGDVEVRQTRGWLHEALPTSPASPAVDSSPVAKLRRRLVAKFRSETCVLATRQLAALRSADKALDAKKARWLKRVCRAWTNSNPA